MRNDAVLILIIAMFAMCCENARWNNGNIFFVFSYYVQHWMFYGIIGQHWWTPQCSYKVNIVSVGCATRQNAFKSCSKHIHFQFKFKSHTILWLVLVKALAFQNSIIYIK